MVEIKDIYNWYTDTHYYSKRPKAPEDATPLQVLEWEEQNQKSINEFQDYLAQRKEKTFVGEQLINAVAFVGGIYRTDIIADAFYEKYSSLGLTIEQGKDPYPSKIFNTGLKDYFEAEFKDCRAPYYDLQIKYRIIYDDNLYETIRLIHNYSQILFDGQILNFEKVSFKYSHHFVSGPMLNCSRSEGANSAYIITIQLSNIKVIEKFRIDAELLLSDEAKEIIETNKRDILEKNRAIDKINLRISQKNSLICGLCGVLIGFIIGKIFGAILLLVLIFGFIGSYFGFLHKRTPKPDWPGKDLIEDLFGDLFG